ncbi:hypothetical protein Tco_0772884, partial [Tanacetum coccineum]
PVDSPTAESPGYVTESNPEEDPDEYDDDATEDGPIDYPMDKGYDGDDDDDDSSGDDADGEDEDDDEEEEEHLAIVPVDEPVFPPEGTEPVIPPPSTDITIGARITVRPQIFISLPPEAEVERLLAMTTPSPSPLISLSPPSAGERLARCTAIPAHSSPPPVPSPLLPSSGCPTQIQTLRIASTQALIDAVTTALPSPPLPPLPPSLYIPPPVDHRDEIPESKQPPHKRLCLSTLGSRYEVGESYTARPTRGRGGERQYGWWRRSPMLLERLGLRDSRSRISQRVDMDSQRVDLLIGDKMTLQETVWMMQQAKIAALQETNRRRQAQMVETLHVMRDMRREMGDMQIELLALRGQRRARQPAPDARISDHQDALGDAGTSNVRRIMAPATRQGQNTPAKNTNPNNMTPESIQAMIDQAILRNSTNGDGSHSVVGLTRWIEKMELVFNISGCAIENQVKFATCTLLGAALTWWNGQIRTLGPEAYAMTWEVLKKKMMDK